VEKKPLCVWSFDVECNVSIPPGDYDLSITVVNRDKHSDRYLTHDEWYVRDDLERYEIVFLQRGESKTDP
jgi:hypothetical protein